MEQGKACRMPDRACKSPKRVRRTINSSSNGERGRWSGGAGKLGCLLCNHGNSRKLSLILVVFARRRKRAGGGVLGCTLCGGRCDRSPLDTLTRPVFALGNHGNVHRRVRERITRTLQPSPCSPLFTGQR